MKEKKIVLNHMVSVLIIILVTSGVMLMTYQQKNIYPFGTGTIAYGDMVQQTIPENLYYMWDVLHGNADAFFSWNSGLGINISGAASEQAYLSPLNLFILLSSRDNLTNFVNILLIIKMVCIAITMYIYLQKYAVNELVRIGSGSLYAFGASSLIHYNLMFVMDMAFLLPLLMIGYDQIFDKKKCGLFILMCTVCLIENVYISAMVFLFLLIKSALHLIFLTEREEEKWEYAFLIGMSVAISIMISMIIILPAIFAISKSSRVQKSFLDIYLQAVNSSWSKSDWNMAKYMLINLTLPFAVCFYNFIKFKNSKYYKERIILVILLLLPMVISGTELLWHGGSRVWWPIRFAFLMSFAIIDFSIRLWQNMNDSFSENKRGWSGYLSATIIGALCSRGLYLIFLRIKGIDTYKELLCMIVTCFCGIGYYIVFNSKKMQQNMMIFLLIFEVSLMSHLCIAPNLYNTNEYFVEYLKDSQILKNSLMNKTRPFERVKNSDGKIANVNYSLILGEESLANYIHVIGGAFQPVLREWGYSTHWTRLLDTGGTVFTDALLGVNYVINESELSNLLYNKISECEGGSGIHYNIYKTKYNIPFVTYIKDDINILSNDIFENQNVLFKATTNVQENIIDEYKDIKMNESTILTLEGKKILYFYGQGNENVVIKINGEDIEIPGKENIHNVKYPSSFNNNLICLGGYENQRVVIDLLNVQNADGIHLGLLDVETLGRGIDCINREWQGNVKVNRNNTGVQIELDSNKDGDIFLPIFYDKGWRGNINGSEAEIENAFGFLKVPIQQGENIVQLKYIPPGKRTGLIITIVGILICAVFLIRCNRQHGRKLNYVYHVSYFILMALFYGIIILFYVVPVIKYFERLFIFKS